MLCKFDDGPSIGDMDISTIYFGAFLSAQMNWINLYQLIECGALLVKATRTNRGGKAEIDQQAAVESNPPIQVMQRISERSRQNDFVQSSKLIRNFIGLFLVLHDFLQ